MVKKTTTRGNYKIKKKEGIEPDLFSLFSINLQCATAEKHQKISEVQRKKLLLIRQELLKLQAQMNSFVV